MILDGLSALTISDGGMGTALLAEDLALHEGGGLGPWWATSVLVKDPTRVEAIHCQHIKAGSEVILTCSYQAFAAIPREVYLTGDAGETLPHQEQNCFDERVLAEACELAAAVAHRARIASNKRILIGGSVGPIGASLPGAREFTGKYWGVAAGAVAAFYTQKLLSLWASGVDFLAFETFPRIDEAVLALQLVQQLSDGAPSGLSSKMTRAPTACTLSFVTHNGASLPCGATVGEAMTSLGPFVGNGLVAGIGFNCCCPPVAYRASSVLLGMKGSNRGRTLALIWKPNVSVAAAATASCDDSALLDTTLPTTEPALRDSFRDYSSRIMRLVARNASYNRQSKDANDKYLFDRAICGGCCGTTADDVAWLSKTRDVLLSEGPL